MSIEKNLYEALRWLRTGEDDLDAAIVLRENKKFPHACFHAQQAGEKALKAVWHYADADPWGHSTRKLIEDLQNVDLSLYDRLKSLLKAGICPIRSDGRDQGRPFAECQFTET